MYRLEYLPVLKRDLEEIIEYRCRVAGDYPAAEALCINLMKAAESLKRFPYIGIRLAAEFPLKREYRILLIRKHLLFFTIDEERKMVTLVRVIYGWKKYDKLLKLVE